MDDQNFIDGGDFSEYNGDDVTESIDAAGQPFTVIVCHDGGQLKFFKVVDRDALSPQYVDSIIQHYFHFVYISHVILCFCYTRLLKKRVFKIFQGCYSIIVK